MAAKELFNISIASLATSTFSTKWSEDDHISIITENGVHTFQLIPCPTYPKRAIQLQRSFIYASDILPNDKFTEDANTLMVNWAREEVYNFLMEVAISPTVNRVNKFVPRVIDIAWSPKGLAQPSKCLLAMLTSAGAVELLYKINRDWYSIYDVCTYWYNILQNESHGQLQKFDGCYKAFQQHARKLQATAIAWSKLLKCENTIFAYLAIAYRSSDITIWKVDKIADCQQDNIKPLEMVNKINLQNNVNIKHLQWISITEKKFLLLVGYHDGNLQCVEINEISDSVINLNIKPNFILEADRIPITSILLLQQNNSGIIVVIVKSIHLLFLHLSSDGDLLKNLMYRNSGLQISGLIPLSTEDVLVSTENGKLSILKFSMQGITNKSISSSELFSNCVRCLGISGSANKIIFVTVTSPGTMYDHLVNREPTIVHFFYINDNEQKDPMIPLMDENVNHSPTHWDYLELIRIKALSDQNYAQRFPLVTLNCLNLLTVDMLRNMLCAISIKRICEKKEQCTEAGEKEIKTLIFLHSASAILLHLAATKTELSNDEKLCIFLLRSYLQAHLINEKTYKMQYALKALDSTLSISTEDKEVCNLCGTTIADVAWKTMNCPLGHKLPRCSATLLQITVVKYRSCPICKSIFHPCLDQIWEEPQCTFCNVPLLYDDRTHRLQGKGCMKNLSKPSNAVLRELKSENKNAMDDEDGDCDVDVIEL